MLRALQLMFGDRFQPLAESVWTIPPTSHVRAWTMKAAVHVHHAEHQRTHAAAVCSRLRRHGLTVELAPANRPRPCDFAVTWGCRQQRVIGALRATHRHVLVMERGFRGDRFAYTSMGWDGLNGRADFCVPDEAPADRWEALGLELKPWRRDGTHARLLGQVPGDASLAAMGGWRAWSQARTDALEAEGHRVVWRPHPRRPCAWTPGGAVRSRGTLAVSLSTARLAVAFNSNALVEAVLAGVDVESHDDGAMVRALRGCHDRERWLQRLAWCQWRLEEIASGESRRFLGSKLRST